MNARAAWFRAFVGSAVRVSMQTRDPRMVVREMVIGLGKADTRARDIFRRMTMKIAITSDLHADFGPAARDAIKRQAEKCAEEQADLIIIAGDLAVDENLLGWCLETLRAACPVAWVFGNHDVWLTSNRKLLRKGQDAWFKALELFPTLARQTNTHYLLDSPLWLPERRLAICGNGGWYDYSSANPAIPMTPKAFERKQFLGAETNDRYYAVWQAPMPLAAKHRKIHLIPRTPDPTVAKLLLNLLKDQLDAAAKANAKIIAVSHMVPWREFMKYTGNPTDDYLAAFYGNMNIGKVYEEKARNTLKLAVFGHTHRKVDGMAKNGVRCVNSPLGYVRKPSDVPDDLGLVFVTRRCQERRRPK